MRHPRQNPWSETPLGELPVAMALSDEDLSQPVSSLLRQGTARAHESAERSLGAASLVKGELDKLEYVRFLMMLWQVYSTLEAGLEEHQNEPVLKPTYNPFILSRAASLSSDIAFLLGTPEWQHHAIYQALVHSPPIQLSSFIDRLRLLSSSSDTSYLLLAHAYVRYLGDLSGGQMIRKQLVKAYNLPHTGEGVRFYMFSNGEEELSPTEVKELKERYRDGMNLGVGDNEVWKEALVNEAILSFKLNQGLFAAIQVTDNTKNTPVAEKSSPILHSVPSTPFSTALSILFLSLTRYTPPVTKGSTAFILTVALFSVIPFIASGFS